jgi:uncharacterized damage-inducible protein DinB
MAWANKELFTQLSTLPESALSFTAWNPEWSVGKIANHIVIAQGRLISRLQKENAPEEVEFAYTSDGMRKLVVKAAENDTKIMKFLDMPEEMLTFVRYGETVTFLSTSVIAQFVHHATEHRAQIADIMAVNNMDVINLDAIDLWSFERSERD